MGWLVGWKCGGYVFGSAAGFALLRGDPMAFVISAACAFGCFFVAQLGRAHD